MNTVPGSPPLPSSRVRRARQASTGEVLAGRFRLVRPLGEGGYGSVYEAFDLQWKTRVALKTLHRMDPDSLLRFKDEFRSLQDLVHPHLVLLHELMCSEGLWFFTMELIEGTDFFDWVRPVVDRLGGLTLRRLDERRLRRALSPLADAMTAVHESGRVHCDIKPTNIRVDREGRVALLDFGLVTELDGQHARAEEYALGTPSYMAPEQCRSDAVTEATDWYSLGVVLYEALTGRLPFEGDSQTILSDKQHHTPLHPLELAPEVPRDLADLCAELLDPDPERRPRGTSVLARLASPNDGSDRGAAARIVHSVSEAPFIGRASELEHLRTQLAATRSGGPAFAYVSGESGVGKTALVRAFSERARAEDGALILRGRCHERETVPYKALDGIVDDLARYLSTLDPEVCRALLPRDGKLLAQVFPVLSRVQAIEDLPLKNPPQDPKVRRKRTFFVLGEILARLAERQPVVLAIDDLQWTDLDSLAVLQALLEPPLCPPCLLVATGRSPAQLPDELREALLPLLAGPGAVHLELGGLPPEEAEQLVRGLSRKPHESRVFRRIASETRGHPLFLAEIVRHIEAGRAIHATFQVDDAVRERILALEPEAQRLLATLATAGAPTPHVVLARALGLNATQLGRRLAQLRAMHLVRSENSARVECYHDRVQRTVLDTLSPELQRECHRALASGLSMVGGSEPEQVAFAWRAAGDAQRAARYCAQAAEAAFRALAFKRAVRLYDEALAHPEAFEPLDLAELRVAHAKSLSAAGFAARAADVYLEASLTPERDASEARALRRTAAQLMLRSGRVAEGLQLADRVLREALMSRPTTPASAVLRLLWERTRLAAHLHSEDPGPEVHPLGDQDSLDLLWAVAPSLAFVDMIGGSALQSKYARLALASGDVQHVVRSLAMEALLFSTMERAPQPKVTSILERVRAAAERSGQPYHRALSWLAHGYVHWSQFRLDEAVPALVQAEYTLREHCVDVAWELTNARMGLLNALWNSGKLWQHDELSSGWLRDAAERGDRNEATQLTVIGLAYQAELRQGRPDTAERLLLESLSGWPETFQLPHWSQYIARQLVALYRADGSAHALLLETWPKIERSQLLRVPYFALLTHSDAAWACLDEAVRHAGKRRAALLHDARQHGRATLRTRWPFAQGLADQIAGQAYVIEGKIDEALPLLERTERTMRTQQSIYQYPTAYLTGVLVGGDSGRALRSRALEWAGREAVAYPEQWFSMFSPALRALR